MSRQSASMASASLIYYPLVAGEEIGPLDNRVVTGERGLKDALSILRGEWQSFARPSDLAPNTISTIGSEGIFRLRLA